MPLGGWSNPCLKQRLAINKSDKGYRLDVWVASSGLLGPSSITHTGPTELLNCFETNSMAPFFALKYAPAAMAKTTEKRNYPNAAPKDQHYGSIIVVSSVANTHGGCWGPALTMSSHAALGVVKSGVTALKGRWLHWRLLTERAWLTGMNVKGPGSGSTASPRARSTLESVLKILTCAG